MRMTSLPDGDKSHQTGPIWRFSAPAYSRVASVTFLSESGNTWRSPGHQRPGRMLYFGKLCLDKLAPTQHKLDKAQLGRWSIFLNS